MTNAPDPPPIKPPSFWWRLFFAFDTVLIGLNILGVPFLETIGLIEIVDFSVTNLAFVGLCGFIFAKPIGSVVFWRYFFYVALAEAIIVLGVFPAFGIPLYGASMTVGWWLFNLVISFFSLVALNLYAYKIPAIWQPGPQP